MKPCPTIGSQFALIAAGFLGFAWFATAAFASDQEQPSSAQSLAAAAAFESAGALNHSETNFLTKLAAPPAMPAPLKLRANLQVDGTGVFLNQVLESGGSELPHLRLCDPPAFGKSLALKRSEIVALAASAGFESIPTNWAGPEVSRVSRRVRELGEKEVLELVTSTLQQHYVKELGQLELRASRPWTPVNVPDEAFTIQIEDLPTSGVSSAFIVRFDLQTASGERVGSWQVPLQAKVWREVWVARSAVKRGESVRSADLARERRDMLLFHEAFAEFSPDDASLEFNEPLQPGSPLLARLVKPRSIVHRGQSLAAVVRDGALMITLKVEALEDGAAGQLIRVRNPLSRRDLHARIVDEANVQVSL